MTDASLYGVVHPILSADISENFTGTPIPYCGNFYPANGVLGRPNLYGGLRCDTVEISRNRKDKNIFTKLLLGTGLSAAIIFAVKGGKNVFAKLKNLSGRK